MKKPLLFITNVLIFALGMQFSDLINSKLAFACGVFITLLVSWITATVLKKEEENEEDTK